MLLKKSGYGKKLRKLILNNFEDSILNIDYSIKVDVNILKFEKNKVIKHCAEFLKKNYDYIICSYELKELINLECFKEPKSPYEKEVEQILERIKENLSIENGMKMESRHDIMDKFILPFNCFIVTNKGEESATIIFFLSDIYDYLANRRIKNPKEKILRMKDFIKRADGIKVLFIQDIFIDDEEFNIEIINLKREYVALKNTLSTRAYTLVKGNDGKERPIEEETIKYFEKKGYFVSYVYNYYPLPDIATLLTNLNLIKTLKNESRLISSITRYSSLPDISSILDKLKLKNVKIEIKKQILFFLLKMIILNRKNDKLFGKIWNGYKNIDYTKNMEKRELGHIKKYLKEKNNTFDKFISLPLKELIELEIFELGSRNQKGVPDLFVWNPKDNTDSFFCEVKSQNDILSHFQMDWINANKDKVKIKVLQINNSSKENIKLNKETSIRGLQFSGVKVKELNKTQVDEELSLKHEPQNEYDPNAIQVLYRNKFIGYLPKDLTNKSKLINAINKGDYKAKISKVEPSKELKKYQVFLQLSF